MIMKFFARLTGGRVIWVKDMHGECYKTVLYINPFGDMYCYLSPFTRGGHCLLLKNGRVSEYSSVSSARQWTEA